MGHLLPTQQLIVDALHSVAAGRYSITSAYVVCFYDWIISLDQEVAFIYPARWSAVKCAYLFCRYYPLAIAPFHFWGFIGDHEQRVCESYYHALYACTVPTMVCSQCILMLRTYAFTGRKKTILAALSISLFSLVGLAIWVMSKQISLSALFIVRKRSGCFATSDQTFGVVRTAGAYHLGLISLFSTIFDCLNMFLMIWHCIRQRGTTLGPLGQTVLRQGILVYAVLTALNALTIGTYFTSNLLHQGIGSWFTYILPSALTCRLVLMLRRKASPTETKLHDQYSHIVNEALEMMESHYEETSEGLVPSSSAHAQP